MCSIKIKRQRLLLTIEATQFFPGFLLINRKVIVSCIRICQADRRITPYGRGRVGGGRRRFDSPTVAAGELWRPPAALYLVYPALQRPVEHVRNAHQRLQVVPRLLRRRRCHPLLSTGMPFW